MYTIFQSEIMSTNTKLELYEDLKKRILTLDLEPGIDLDEVRISTEYGLSRTPVREVFRRLAGEGYIEIINNRGASVSSMNHKTLRDFYLVAPLIYSTIGRLAVMNATTVQVKELKAAQVKFKQAVKSNNPDKMAYYNDCFHSITGDMADNKYIQPSLQRLLVDHARIAQTFYRPKDSQMQKYLDTAAKQHDQIIAAIEQRDEEKAAKISLKHWEISRKRMEMFVIPDALPYEPDLVANG